jgi:sulfatase maturation enzyme AslB (radical SAM superfamily)
MTENSNLDTFCSRLWTELFINQDGNVYTCCHRQPAVLGNVLTEPLEAIFAGPALRLFHYACIDGQLPCYRNCSFRNEKKTETMPETLGASYSGLQRLKVLFGEACNLSCTMCSQSHGKRSSLAAESLIAHVNLAPFSLVEIQGGEPLFIPDAVRYLDYAIEQGKKVMILTNGTLITSEWAEKLALHGQMVHISLNAATKETHEQINRGSRWEQVLNGIALLRGARDRHQSNLRIRGHMSIVPENLDEIAQFIAQFKTFGFDEIQFSVDKRVPPLLDTQPLLKDRLASEIGEALEACDRRRVNTKRLELLKLVAPPPSRVKTTKGTTCARPSSSFILLP